MEALPAPRLTNLGSIQVVPEAEALLGGRWGLGPCEEVGATATGRGVCGVQEHEKACRRGTGWAAEMHPQVQGTPGLRALSPWPVVWSYPGPWLCIRRQWASVKWPTCQPQVFRSKLQETSGGRAGSAPHPSAHPSRALGGQRLWGSLEVCWEPPSGNEVWTGETLVFLSGCRGAAVPHGHVVHPGPLLARAVPVHQTYKLQLQRGRGKGLTSGPGLCPPLTLDYPPHPEWPVACSKKDLVHRPAPCAAAWGLPHQLPGAALQHHQCQEAWQRESWWVSLPQTPPSMQGSLGTGRGLQAGSTLGVTVEIVSHVELTVGA